MNHTFDFKCVGKVAFRADIAHELAHRYFLIVGVMDSFTFLNYDRKLVFDIFQPKVEWREIFHVANDVG